VIVAHKTPKATLLYCTPLAVAEIGGRVCYDSFESSENSVIKFFKQNPEHFIHTTKDEDILSSDLLYKLAHVHFHHSVLEHIQLSYYIKDIPRNVIMLLKSGYFCNVSAPLNKEDSSEYCEEGVCTFSLQTLMYILNISTISGDTQLQNLVSSLMHTTPRRYLDVIYAVKDKIGE
jgi:hypothetical protein